MSDPSNSPFKKLIKFIESTYTKGRPLKIPEIFALSFVAFVATWFLTVIVLALAGIVLGTASDIFFPGVDAGRTDERLRNYTIILGALVAAPFAIWRLVIAQKNLKLGEQRHITERFIKAVELLGAMRGDEPALEQRLGAIYALEWISKESEADHIQIMEVLCAYIRTNAPATEDRWPGAILRDLEKARPHITDDEIEKDAEFSAAVERSGVTTLPKLREWARMAAFFNPGLCEWVANLPLPGADISAVLDVIGRRDKTRQRLERDQEPTYRLDLRRSNLRRVDLSQKAFDCVLFSYSQMEGATFHKTQMEGARFEFALVERAEFFETQMKGAYFANAKMDGADFLAAQLEGAQFHDAQMEGAWFTGAYLKGAKFSQAKMKGARFTGSLLAGTCDQLIVLNSTDLRAATNNGGALRFVDLRRALVDARTDFRNAFGDGSVKLHDAMARPQHWPAEILDDAEFFGRWRGWLDAGPRNVLWNGIAPAAYKNVHPIAPDKANK